MPALLVSLAACSGDDDDEDGNQADSTEQSEESEPTDNEGEDGGDAFCEAAADFRDANAVVPETEDPGDLEERLNEMVEAAEAMVDAGPDDLEGDAEAFLAAVEGLRDFAADADYDIDLGGGSPDVQTPDGQAVSEEGRETVGPVDEAVQDECGEFLVSTDPGPAPVD